MGFSAITLLSLFALNSPQDTTKPSDSLNFWRKGGEAGLNAAFSGTSPNWSGGAANNIAGNIFLNAFANRTWDHSSWDNTLKINIGAISSKLKDNNGQEFRSTKKNMDNVFMDSKYGYSFEKLRWLSGFGGLNLQTQLLRGFTYGRDANGREIRNQVSSFLSQGSLMSAIGVEAKPSDRFFARVALFSLKQTFMLNQRLYNLRNTESIAGVGKGNFVRSEAGFQVQTGLKRSFTFSKQIHLTTNYLAFIPYNFRKNNSPLDSRIDLAVNVKLARFLNMNYTLISIFDKDLARPGENAWQNSWVLGFGFHYQL
jgi:hypothetical protein